MSIFLILHAEKIITDSGGLQREAFFAQKQCVTIFDHVVWPETMIDNRNQLAKADKEDILCKLRKEQVIRPMVMPFGNGHSAEKIVETITNYISSIG